MEIRLNRCGICLKRFKRKDTLMRHKLSHKSKRTFNCSQCGKEFKHLCSLQHHTKYKHSDPTLFKCNVCDKNFVSKKNLKYHLNKHAQAPTLKCEQCDSTFYNPWTKSRHKQKEVIY